MAATSQWFRAIGIARLTDRSGRYLAALRLRDEDGFGLVELMIAMMVLSVAVFALLTAFSSATLTLQRAARTSTAATLADAGMERMRAIRYCDIWLSGVPDTPLYTADPAYNGGVLVTASDCTGPAPAPAIPASTDTVAADGRTYRVDTYVVEGKPADAGGAIDVSRAVKTVTLVVRDPTNSFRVLTRQSSTLDEATGESPPDESEG
jgi:prepilin-type N-terminal cleavage/methylation domain-containing protein